MLRFQTVTSSNLKIENPLLTLATSNIQGLFMNEFDLMSSEFEVIFFFLKKFITKNREVCLSGIKWSWVLFCSKIKIFLNISDIFTLFETT